MGGGDEEAEEDRDRQHHQHDEFVREEIEGGTIETEGPSGQGCLLVVLAVLAIAILLGLLVSSSHR